MKKVFSFAAAAVCVLSLVGCVGYAQPTSTPTVPTTPTTPDPTTSSFTLRAEVWADNWFALYSGETLIKEDSVPITTERSFNSESFTFVATYPLHLNFVVKDYKANDTGLEYIGTAKQQMGDGGFVAQFTDVATGKIIAVTNQNARVLVIHKAPLNVACVKETSPVAGRGPCTFISMLEPANWKKADFENSGWSKATVFNAAAVGPKEGYLDISWNSSAQFIWGSDLFADNTVLVRLPVVAQ